VTTGSGPRPTAHGPGADHADPRTRSRSPITGHAGTHHPQPPPATHKGALKPGVPDGLNPPIYSLVSYTVLEEAGAKATGVARGGG